MELKEKLNKELERELGELEGLELGSDQMQKAAATIEMMHKLRMNEVNSDRDLEVKKAELEAKEKDLALETKKAKDAKVIAFVGTGVTLGTFAIKLVNDNLWMAKGFKFEETGTFCSKVFGEIWRGFFHKK